MKTVIGLFDEFHEAQNAVTNLLNHNVDRADISVVSNRSAIYIPQTNEAYI